MFSILFVHLFGMSVVATADDTQSKDLNLKWEKLNPLPNVRGVATPFAGVHGSVVIAGGGANFPDKLPWEGGKKVWYDAVWILDRPEGSWRQVGTLPRPLAYGVSISTSEGVVCVGGSDAERHFADVFQLSWDNNRLSTKTLPSLPHPIANACGAMLGTTILIAGGTESPSSTSTLKSFLSLDMAKANPAWKALEPWPGPGRMLAVASVQDGSFFLTSGTDLLADEVGKPKRRYLTDAYRYRPGSGWQSISDVPRAVVAAPSPAFEVGAKQFLIIGGDDGTKVDFQPIDKHPGFPRTILMYDIRTNSWKAIGEAPAGHVTSPTVRWNEKCLIVSGEIRPGVRSPDVWSLQIGPRE